MNILAQRGIAQGRPVALIVTIGVHVALVAGLLAIQVVEAVKEYTTPIRVTKIEEKKKPVPVEKLGDPDLKNPAAVPQLLPDIPEIEIEEPALVSVLDTPIQVISSQPSGDAGALLPAVPDTPLRYQAIRPAHDYYPPQAIRMASEGAVIVRACVDSQGRLAGAPSVVRTSSASLLDGAAVKWASEALRFQPATRAGAAVPSCKEFRVSFTLR